MGFHRYDLVTMACLFALRAHWGRVFSNSAQNPVLDHISEVAGLVKEVGGSDIEVAAAWLHDTVEDTKVEIEDIEQRFGPIISGIVNGLTDPSEFSGLPTLIRKMRQAERVRLKDKSVKLIKIADQLSNINSIMRDPPVRWSRGMCYDYFEGARLVVVACRDASPALEKKFDEAYIVATELYK